MDIDDCGLVNLSVAAAPSSRPTGGEKRRLANALPRVLLVYSRDAKVIIGAILVSAAFAVSSRPQIVWMITQFVSLVTPYACAALDFMFTSTVSRLTPEIESTVRTGLVTAGGTMNEHFFRAAGAVWSVVRFPVDLCNQISRHDYTMALMLPTAPPLTKALGVVPESVDEVPNLAQEYENAAAAVGMGTDSVAPVAVSSGSNELSEAVGSAEGVRGIAHEVAGASGHRFDPARLLSCLNFARHLKPSALMTEALADASNVLDGQRSDSVQDDLRSNKYPLPSLDTLRMARVKLDVLSMLFERFLQVSFCYLRYFVADSSPQLGYNFLCMREDRIRMPRAEVTFVLRYGYDLSAAFESRLCLHFLS